jgi:hypothetical protein
MACLPGPAVRGRFNPRISDAVGWAGWAGLDRVGPSRSGTDLSSEQESRTFPQITTINISTI